LDPGRIPNTPTAGLAFSLLRLNVAGLISPCRQQRHVLVQQETIRQISAIIKAYLQFFVFVETPFYLQAAYIYIYYIYSRLSIIRAWFSRFAAQPQQCIFKEKILFSVSITFV
jgi:hypothetical protein